MILYRLERRCPLGKIPTPPGWLDCVPENSLVDRTNLDCRPHTQPLARCPATSLYNHMWSYLYLHLTLLVKWRLFTYPPYQIIIPLRAETILRINKGHSTWDTIWRYYHIFGLCFPIPKVPQIIRGNSFHYISCRILYLLYCSTVMTITVVTFQAIKTQKNHLNHTMRILSSNVSFKCYLMVLIFARQALNNW